MEEELPVGATRRDLFLVLQILAMDFQLIEEGRISCEPIAHRLPVLIVFSTSADAMWAVCPGHRRRKGNTAN